MTEWELWACAAEMRKQHGADAPLQAAIRADAMLEADDRAGYAIWAQILTYIAKLGPILDEGATCH